MQAISVSKLTIFLVFGVLALLAFTAPASASSTYYPTSATPYYTSYSQPVYYQYSSNNTAQLLAQIQSLQAQLIALQNQYRVYYGHSYSSGYGPGYSNCCDYRYSNNRYDIDVDTRDARNIDRDEATLYGEVDLDDAPYADVWFEYGQDGDLDEKSDEERIDDNDDDRFSIDIDDLDEDENYYFRAVAEDPRGDRVYGQIRSFTTDDDGGSSSDDDEPTAETMEADNVTDDSADIEGEVDMNDFRNGLVFFVWGEDEDAVEDVEDEDSYRDVDEDGDDLQKYKVDSDLDDDERYVLEIDNLDDNTDYYFRICVEYEDEDDDQVLECGDVEHFETD